MSTVCLVNVFISDVSLDLSCLLLMLKQIYSIINYVMFATCSVLSYKVLWQQFHRELPTFISHMCFGYLERVIDMYRQDVYVYEQIQINRECRITVSLLTGVTIRYG